MRSLLALLILMAGCNFGADYHDPCAGRYDEVRIASVLPAGDGTFWVITVHDYQPPYSTALVQRIAVSGTILSQTTAAGPGGALNTVENGALVRLFGDRLITVPLDGSDPVATPLQTECQARAHFPDGKVLGETGYWHQPCVFTAGSTTPPLVLGDGSDTTWFVTRRAPDGGWISWHQDILYRFDATGAVLWAAPVTGSGLPSQLLHTSSGWLISFDASVEAASTVQLVSDDGKTVQTIFSARSHPGQQDPSQTYYEPLGQLFVFGDRIGITTRTADPKTTERLTLIDATGAIHLETILPFAVGSVFPIGDGVVLAGTGILRIDGDQITSQRTLEQGWGVAYVFDDGSAFVGDTTASDCLVRTRLGLLDPAGHPLWWN